MPLTKANFPSPQVAALTKVWCLLGQCNNQQQCLVNQLPSCVWRWMTTSQTCYHQTIPLLMKMTILAMMDILIQVITTIKCLSSKATYVVPACPWRNTEQCKFNRASPPVKFNDFNDNNTMQNMTAKNDYLIHEIDVAVSDILGMMWTECHELFVILNPFLL